MAQVEVNGFNLEYEWHGDRTNPPIIGIHGFTHQLICWPRTFIEGITGAGYSFVVFDSREIGLSTPDENAESPDISGVLDGTAEYHLPYTIEDMATDTISLMDALNIEKAQVVGYSIGGYKALLAALDAPERITSVTTINSSALSPNLPLGDDDLIQATIEICFPFENREEFSDRLGDLTDFYNGRKYGYTTEEQNAEIIAKYDRGWYADGIARHALAILRRKQRFEEFEKIKQPTLIVHGTEDCFFSKAHAQDLLSRLPDARLATINGAGHALTNALSEVIMPAIVGHLDAAH